MFTAQESTEIRRPPANTWAFLDDFAGMPRWLESCVSVEARPREARAAGTPLTYRYSMAGQEGTMTGSIVTHEPERELALAFDDEKFGVKVGFRLEPTEIGVRVFHSIAVELKFSLPRYMEAMVQAGNRKQVGSNLAKLKRLVESASEPPPVLP